MQYRPSGQNWPPQRQPYYGNSQPPQLLPPNTQWGQQPYPPQQGQWQQPYMPQPQQPPYAPYQPQMPQAGNIMQKPISQKRPTFVIIFSLFLIGLGVVGVLSSVIENNQNTSSLTSTPYNTLTTFCGGLKNHDYQTSFNQLSNNQSQFTNETNFASAMNGMDTAFGGITDCTVYQFEIHENDATGVANGPFTLDFGNGNSTIFNARLVNENGSWKIAEITY